MTAERVSPSASTIQKIDTSEPKVPDSTSKETRSSSGQGALLGGMRASRVVPSTPASEVNS